jgi:putative peptide zinc metalloprotease protein
VTAALLAVPDPIPAFRVEPLDPETDARYGDVIPSRLRADILVQRQFFNHKEYYVLKDPLALNYFRLKPEEAYLTTLLNGKRKLRDVYNLYNAKYPNLGASLPDIALFINHLGIAGLLNMPARRFLQSVQLPKGYRPSKSLLGVWAKIISGMLFVKVPLLDPSPWLGKLVHSVRFLWSKWFVGGMLLFFAWTLGLLFYNREAFHTPMPNFFAPSNLFLLYLTTILIKTCHEFGHATTCRRFGGEVHEMGACLLCFMPCGYVDASDAWMMRFKRHKIYTTVAGVFTEFILACIAAHLWLFLPDSLLRSLAFNAMLVASVNTIFFNANPLMRFDGYYVLCDLLEIPNLRAKAITYCSARVRGWLLGYRDHDQESFVEQDKGPAFVAYAICAYFYMFLIIYGLSMIFARVLEPYGLKDFGLLIGVFVEGSYAMLPVIKAVSDGLSANERFTRTEAPLRRMGKGLAVIAAAVIGVFLWPTHYYVHQQGVVFCSQGESVAAMVSGQISQVLVRTGQWVEAGQVLMVLSNPEATENLARDNADFDIAKLRMSYAMGEKRWDIADQLPQADIALNHAGMDVERSAKEIERLQLRSSVAGRVLTSDLDKLVGRYIKAGQVALRIGDPGRLKVVIPLTEDQARLVDPGSPLTGRYLANGERFQSRVVKAPRQRAKETELHEAMFALFGGPIPQSMPHARTSSMADAQQTLYSVYLAEALIDHPPAVLREGMRAQVEITGQPTTLGKSLWRSFLTLWRLKVPV